MKILVPVDFSDAASKALFKALQIAQKTPQSEVILLHGLATMTEQEAKTKLQATIGEYAHHNVKFSIWIEETFTPERVARIVEQDSQIELVVMGTAGKTRVGSFWSDSKTAKVEKLLTCPLMIIPKNIDQRPIRKMAYILGFEKEDFEEIDRVLNLAQLFDAHVECLRLTEKDDQKEKQLLDVMTQSYDLPQYKGKITFASLIHKNLINALEKYVTENKVDITVLLTEQRSFWENNFGSTLTQKLTSHAKIPLLILNKDESK